MHGVLRLIQNELSKILHQMSWKILTLLLLLLSLGTPILAYLFNAGYDGSGYYENAEKTAEEYEEGSIAKEYYLNIASCYNYFKEQGFVKNEWHYDNYFQEYLRANETAKGCRLYIDGRDIEKILDYFYIENVYYYWEILADGKEIKRIMYEGHLSGESQPVEVTAPDGSIEIADGYERKEVPFTVEIAEKIVKECEERLEIIKEKLKQTFEEFAKDQIAIYQTAYEQAKENFEKAETAYERDKSTVREYTAARLIKEGYDIFFNSLNKLDLNKVSKDMQNSFALNLSYTDREIQGGPEYSPMSEKEFDEINNGYGVYYKGGSYYDYPDYLRAVEQRQNQYYRVIKKYVYCLEHNLRTVNNFGSRSMTEDCLTVNLTVIMLMGIFMAAVIVASEHTSGAVRLLMIRPRARWKILLSKLCCVMLFLIGWIVSTSILSTVANGILYGWEDLSLPYVMVNSEAYEVAPLPYLIMKMTVSYLPGLSMVFLAFLMSVLIKRAVVSMAIPMIIYIFGGAASTLFIGRACKVFPPLKFTPIPYFDLSSFWGEPVLQLNAYTSPLDHGLTLNMGVLMFVIYSVILIAAAFVIFKKQQIKN